MDIPMTTDMIQQRIPLSDNLHPPHKTLAAILEADKIREQAEERSLHLHRQTSVASTVRVSLMMLMEDDDEVEEEGYQETGQTCSCCSCCVCMTRKKGAAFIPCGHTFCRVCSREMMESHRNCPLCNASIAGVLDIF